MNLKNCIKCGKVFNDIVNKKICPLCIKKEEDQFNLVRDYLRENPRSSIEKVEKETSVDRDTIIRYIKENRLIAENIDNVNLTCDSCGITINQGRFCQKCIKTLAEGLKPEEIKKKQKSLDKMYFTENKHKN